MKVLLDRVYWAWRFSILSRPYYFVKTWVHLILHARAIALHLDDCMRAMGQMNHTSSYKGTCRKCGEKISLENPDRDCMLMKTPVRGELIHRSWKTLPAGWKWRND